VVSLTRFEDLGSVSFLLDVASVLKAFKGCEVLSDLTLDKVDGFTLERDECKSIYETLKNQANAIKPALSP